MTASVIYHLMALNVDLWFIQAVDRLRRGFLWAGRPGARGGCCLVAWDKVCVPKSLPFARVGYGFRRRISKNLGLASGSRCSLPRPPCSMPLCGSQLATAPTFYSGRTRGFTVKRRTPSPRTFSRWCGLGSSTHPPSNRASWTWHGFMTSLENSPSMRWCNSSTFGPHSRASRSARARTASSGSGQRVAFSRQRPPTMSSSWPNGLARRGPGVALLCPLQSPVPRLVGFGQAVLDRGSPGASWATYAHSLQALLRGRRNPQPPLSAMPLCAECLGRRVPTPRVQPSRSVRAELLARVVAVRGCSPLEGRQ
jgi:hypothetical protein